MEITRPFSAISPTEIPEGVDCLSGDVFVLIDRPELLLELLVAQLHKVHNHRPANQTDSKTNEKTRHVPVLLI